MRKIRTNKGITLIALIITIIILLILAVVSIRLVVNNGILGKAEHATTKYGTEEEQEQIKIGYADYQMAKESGVENPQLTVAGAKVTRNETDWTVKFSKTGNVYTINDNGEVSYSNSESDDNLITSTKIKENPSIYYGKNVNYSATVKNQDSKETENITGWKIFYADANIYLISENFINCNVLPATTGGHRPNYTNSGDQPRANFNNNNLTNYYSGSDNINENNPARKWLDLYYSKNYSSTNNNMKAVAYMMDTDTWKQYATEGIAEYAIGGPTLELFAASYNNLHPNAIKIDVGSALGYRVEKNGTMDTWNSGLTREESLYVAKLSEGIVLWLASPSYSNGDSIMNLYPGNDESGAGIGNDNVFSVTNNGFRPVVCLKNSVKLKLSSDGSTYDIIP